MKTISKLFTMLSAVALLCIATGSVAKDKLETQAALDSFRAAPETQPFFHSAYGYAVFPSVGKGGFWIGGAYGTGTVYQNEHVTGHAKLYQLSLGLQFGGQAYSEIIFFQDQRAFKRFTSGNFDLDAQASAVALTEGAQAKAGTAGLSASSGEHHMDASYTNGVAVFTFAKGGMMIEASIAGQKFNYTPLGQQTTPPNTSAQDNAEPTAVVVGTLERP
ncbi:hypothetical protein ABT56_08780 [Photobacterium aquae]|uniref:Ysc84 actin-binding domain-containing protein n=1 Tax=Photobacterium aquae TaxID=1195763 RepID=A0A0J1H3V8_9GAMM|nr:lipid-binding SYLF domain-containing protein [Photobacterium aquae]KLV06468.1 hypothetical protein ABT56_08780 [Photobacterium aquae]